MSAWPEAVWLKNEMYVALGLDDKIDALNDRIDALDVDISKVEHRYLFISATTPSVEGGVSKGSLWAKTYE